MPPVNDDLANATVIDQAGLSTVSGTTVDATVEAGKEADDGYFDTVWYRIEPGADIENTLHIRDASFAWYAELYEFPGGGTPADFDDLVDGYANLVDQMDGTGAIDDDTIFFFPDLTAAYYLLVTNEDFAEGIEGTFTLEAFLPEVYECAAAGGANLGSPTVSLPGGGWVREEQQRIVVDADEYQGDLEYTRTFEIDPEACGVPPGDYKVELFVQLDSAGSTASILVQMRKNGKPLGHNVGGFPLDDMTPTWVALTHMDFSNPDSEVDWGGPRYVRLAAGDILSFDMGGWENDDDRYVEVQTVRFTTVQVIAPLPSWRQSIDGAETWGAGSLGAVDTARYHDGVLYVFQDATTEGFSGPGVYTLGVWTWEVDGPDITALSGDRPIGFGGAMTDLSPNGPRSTSTLSIEVQSHDFDVLPNGDIVAAWVEEDQAAGFLSRTTTVYVAKYDASGDSWSIVNSDLADHAGTIRLAGYLTVEADESGDFVYIVFGEARNTGTSAPVGFWWRCKRYDVGADTFTELGTTPTSGITAFPGAPATDTVDGSNPWNLRVRVSPAGVPWVIWPSYDPDLSTDDYYERCFAYFWDGADWVDAEVPDPSLVPADLVDPDIPATIGEYAAGLGSGNYVSFAVYGYWNADVTFCKAGQGITEEPTLAFLYVFDDQQITGLDWDIAGWSIMEYGGTPGDWENEQYLIEGVDYGDVEPKKFAQNYYGFPWDRVGGWTQGFHLDNDGSNPWLFSQKGHHTSIPDHVYAVKLLPGGGAVIPCHGWPDEESFPWGPPQFMGGWMDVTTSAGLIVEGNPVCFWRHWDGFLGGLVFAGHLPCGGIISMNWSSEEAVDVDRIHATV